MELTYSRQALRALQRTQPARRDNFMDRLEAIAAAPHDQHPNVIRLQGYDNEYRLRVGDFRAEFRLDHAADVMFVHHFGPRGSAYR